MRLEIKEELNEWISAYGQFSSGVRSAGAERLIGNAFIKFNINCFYSILFHTNFYFQIVAHIHIWNGTEFEYQ